MLYEVAIVQKPTKKEAEEGKSERLVIGPKAICAGSEQAAGLMAGKELDLATVNPDLLEVYIRPFVGSR